MSRDHAIRGVEYTSCDLCGFIFRITDTILNSAGLRVCKAHDVDARGEFMFAPPPLYSPGPILYDYQTQKYYQLAINGGFLDAVEVPSLGGVIPIPYVAADSTRCISYQVSMQNGSLTIREGVNGKRIPPIMDSQTGVYRQIIVQSYNGETVLALLEI